MSRLGSLDNIKILETSVKFVKQYSYLGITLDSEMTLQPLIKQVKKTTRNKILNLQRIRKYLSEKASVSIYKQPIPPIINYAGFLLLSCGISDRSDLQKIQNDILRLSCKVTLCKHVSIKDLHKRCKIISLNRECGKNLFGLCILTL